MPAVALSAIVVNATPAEKTAMAASLAWFAWHSLSGRRGGEVKVQSMLAGKIAQAVRLFRQI